MTTNLLKIILLINLLCTVFNFRLSSQSDSAKGMGISDIPDKSADSVLQQVTQLKSVYKEIPSSYSLKKYCPTARSQNQTGTCVGWACAYAGLTIAYSIQNGWTDKSTIDNNAFSPGYLYQKIKNPYDFYCQDGAHISEALKVLKINGAAKWNDLPYSCISTISSSIDEIAANNKLYGFNSLFNSESSYYTDIESENKVEKVKKSLSENHPVIVGFNCQRTFNWARAVWVPEYSNYSTSWSHGRHAICVIGYDNDRYGGAFEILNSWGEDWGNSGYIWIRYEDFERFVYQAFELYPKNIITNDENTSEKKIGGVVYFSYENKDSLIKLELSGDECKIKNILYSGDRIRIFIKNNEPTFIYVLGKDKTDSFFTYFPYHKLINPFVCYRNSEFALPDEFHSIRLDNTTGDEFFCIIYSKNEIDITSLRNKLASQSGDFKRNILKELGPQKIVLANKKINENKIVFEGSGSNIVFVKFRHQ